MDSVADKLDDLVLNDDILPVRISKECLIRGRKYSPGWCAGALGIAEALDCPDMAGLKIQVGHKTKEHLSDRVVIKTKEDPHSKWIGWIVNSPGKSGFHPKKYDEGKQRSPGSMMIERWTKEAVAPMPPEKKAELHSGPARERHLEYRGTTPNNGAHRVFNG